MYDILLGDKGGATVLMREKCETFKTDKHAAQRRHTKGHVWSFEL